MPAAQKKPRRPSVQAQFAACIAKFTPDMARKIRAAHAIMRRHVRGSVAGGCELVYDNYNFFVIGFGPSERASEAVFSLAAHAKGVALCFLTRAEATKLPDPHKLLRGGGKVVRSIRLNPGPPHTLKLPAVKALIKESLRRAERYPTKEPVPKGRARLVIRSISKKQRPRRPAKA